MKNEATIFIIAFAGFLFCVGIFIGILQQGALINEMGTRLRTVFTVSIVGGCLMFVGSLIAMTGYIVASYFISK